MSRETVSRITERVVAEKDEWCSRPLDRVYAAVFIDATVVKVRDGQVANRAFYVAVGVDLEGGRDVLGIWASPAAEGARYWLSVLTELKNRGVDDVFFLDLRRAQRPARRGGRGMASGHRADLRGASAAQHVPLRVEEGLGRHQTRCQTHLHRAERRRRGGGPRRDAGQVGGEISRRSAGCGWTRGNGSYRSWTMTWRIRRVICTTNAIESLNARFKRSIRARGHFPDEQAALKCMYLTVRSLDPTGKGRIRWSARWKPVLNAFAITFADRWPSEGTQQ